jgi:hypothetical protein
MRLTLLVKQLPLCNMQCFFIRAPGALGQQHSPHESLAVLGTEGSVQDVHVPFTVEYVSPVQAVHVSTSNCVPAGQTARGKTSMTQFVQGGRREMLRRHQVD